MKLGSIFGTTFFSVLAALVLYDLVVKGIVGNFIPSLSTYDNTANYKELVKLSRDSKRMEAMLKALRTNEERIESETVKNFLKKVA